MKQQQQNFLAFGYDVDDEIEWKIFTFCLIETFSFKFAHEWMRGKKMEISWQRHLKHINGKFMSPHT